MANRKIFGALVFGALIAPLVASAAAASAGDTAPAPAADIAIGIDDILGVGWLKTFPYQAGEGAQIPPGVAIVIPEVHESVLERAVRTEISDMLAARGYALFTREEDAGDDAFVLSVNVEVSNEFEAAPPQSPLRFAPSLNDPLRDDRFRTIEPVPLSIDRTGFLDYDPLYWDSYIRHKKDRRSVSMTVYLYNEGERRWGGFAAAEIGPKGRTALAKAMAAEIADNLGLSADRDPAAFFIDTVPDPARFPAQIQTGE